MASNKTQKELAQRIDPTYHRGLHGMRRLRFFLSLGFVVAAAAAVAASWASGRRTAFSNGGMSRAHAFIERDCAKCHTEAFGSVSRTACLACHVTAPHVPADRGADPACTSCHVEHKGRAHLHVVEDAHCNACHAEHKGVEDLASHVEFRVPEHDQHMRFDHERHMRRDLVDGPLACASCHVPDATGAHFRPIRFAAVCARCHTDRLSGDVPAAVPHGLQPGALRDWIEGAFLREMRADGRLADDPANPMPGAGATRVPPWAEASAKRTDAALAALATPGKARGCLLCHVLDQADGPPGVLERTIARPDVPPNWYAKARFDHAAHRFTDCATCHDMARNRSAETLDLPKVAVCRDCHHEAGAATTCVTCHPYHPR
jgi:hypothetical protein